MVAYVMADAGYDVWLPNHRGNIYSRQNLYKDPGITNLIVDFYMILNII